MPDKAEPVPRANDHYTAKRDVQVTGIVGFAGAPASEGFQAVLARGSVIRVMSAPSERATAVMARPIDYKAFELRFVTEEMRTDPQYSGYAVVIPLRDLKDHFTRR